MFQHYEVANEGSEKLVFLVGDSHTMKLSYRFQQLFRESRIKYKEFPTVVALVRFGMIGNFDDDQYTRKVILHFV